MPWRPGQESSPSGPRRDLGRPPSSPPDRPHPAVLANLPFLTEVTHTFLIRSPAEIAASYYAIRPGMAIGEIGLATLYELYQAVLALSGHPPAVIDSADLVANPAGIMAAYCDVVGIPFTEQAPSWHPGPRAEWSRSAPGPAV